jgi:hypothetical protein
MRGAIDRFARLRPCEIRRSRQGTKVPINRLVRACRLQGFVSKVRAMRWLKPNIRGNLHALLGNLGTTDSRVESAEDDIRDSMLSLLGPSGAKEFPQVARRIRYAEDLQSLWYLRGDLMAAVAATRGESSARALVASVTAQFQGLLPRGLNSRPSPLA